MAFLCGVVLVRGDVAANDFFETRIRPVLVRHCYECHAASLDEPQGGLVLDHRDGLLRGGDSGPAIVAGDAAASLLLKAMRHDGLEMPPDGAERLSDEVIRDFETWIREGAIDPRDQPPTATELAEAAWKEKLAERRGWWSLQTPRLTPIPEVADRAWGGDAIDRYVRAALDAKGLVPASPADGATLLRRMSLVLTGLPPEPDQVDAFVIDYARDPEGAVGAWADRLMNSPHFGERFARHWMDVVRYTDTWGYEWDNPVKGSWEYRDYLTRAFNDDVGFDQLVREQIAGDLLPTPRIDRRSGLNESLIGPLFFHMGEHRHGSSLDFNGIHQEMIDNKIDAFSKAFLGMTVGCARCHDHKLDAISQADYYALAGIFMTPRWTPRDIDASARHAEAIDELTRLRDEIRGALAEAWQRPESTAALRPERLFDWARQNHAALSKLGPDDVGYPLGKLTSITVWSPTRAIDARGESAGTRLTISDDDSVIATGDAVPDKDVYTLRLIVGPGRFDRIRLEALSDPHLPGGGPGRTEHGNFVLTQVAAAVRPVAAGDVPWERAIASAEGEAERPIKFASASADFSQSGYAVEGAIDDSPATGWGIGGIANLNVDRVATFGFAEPIELPHGGVLTVTLRHDYGSCHVLGRFRITVGSGQLITGDASQVAGGKDTHLREELARQFVRMSEAWSAERQRRMKANEAFEVLTDFGVEGFPEGWAVEGLGFRHGYVGDGTPLVALDGERLVDRMLQRGYHTHALSSKLSGAIRPPRPEALTRPRVAIQVAGGDWAGRIDVPQNAFNDEAVTFFDPAAGATWQGIAAKPLKNGVTRVLTEFATATLHPNFPPRTGVARAGATRLPDNDLGRDKRSWLSVTSIVAHETGGAPEGTLDPFVTLYAEHDAAGIDPWQRVSGWLAGAVDRWCRSELRAGDVELVNWMLANGMLPTDRGSLGEVAGLVTRYREIESGIGYARSAMGMDERHVEAVDYRINIRGNVDDEGAAVPRRFLEVFSQGRPTPRGDGSGRLELAETLSGGANPQVARVFVNRLWGWVFGTGLVATPSDFGKLGDPPSHPELLDRLAIEFREEGWSTRRMLRRMVTSRAFGQSGVVDPKGAELDPNNRLLHHYPTRRLEAEAIRDSLLAVSGRLDRRLYGPPINPYRVAEDPAKRLYSGPLDGDGRRSIYMTMSIMEPPKFLVGFNLPDLKLPTGRRDVTNVPAQALIMLNDPFVAAMAGHWGERLVGDGSADPAERIDRMFRAGLGRKPDADELAAWVKAATTIGDSGSDPMTQPAVWTELAHAIFNTKEFIYYR